MGVFTCETPRPITKNDELAGHCRHSTVAILEHLQLVRYMHIYGPYLQAGIVELGKEIEERTGSQHDYVATVFKALETEAAHAIKWDELIEAGEIAQREIMPRDFSCTTQHYQNAAMNISHETSWPMVFECIREYVQIGNGTLIRGYEELIRNNKWAELKARLKNDEANLVDRLYGHCATFYKPILCAINQMRIDYAEKLAGEGAVIGDDASLRFSVGL